MLDYCQHSHFVEFQVRESDIPNMSQELRDAILRSARCVDCSAKIRPDFDCPCLLGTKYRVTTRQWFDEIFPLCKRDQRRVYSRRSAKSRAKHLSAAEGTHTKEDIRELWHIQSGRCYFCLTAMKHYVEPNPFHIDHLTPISRGGTQWPSNLALVCASCNCSKNDQNEREFWRRVVAKYGASFVGEQEARLTLIRKSRTKISNNRRRSEKISLTVVKQAPESGSDK